MHLLRAVAVEKIRSLFRCVPRTIESSINNSLRPRTSSSTGMSFMRAIRFRWPWSLGVKLRGQVGVYLISGRVKGTPERCAYPIACAMPESGTPATESIGISRPVPQDARRSGNACSPRSPPRSSRRGTRNMSTGRADAHLVPRGRAVPPSGVKRTISPGRALKAGCSPGLKMQTIRS